LEESDAPHLRKRLQRAEVLNTVLCLIGHVVRRHTRGHFTQERRGSWVGWKSVVFLRAPMAAERLAIVEEGCWLDRVADSRKLAIAPMASSCSGGNEISLTRQYTLNLHKLPA